MDTIFSVVWGREGGSILALLGPAIAAVFITEVAICCSTE